MIGVLPHIYHTGRGVLNQSVRAKRGRHSTYMAVRPMVSKAIKSDELLSLQELEKSCATRFKLRSSLFMRKIVLLVVQVLAWEDWKGPDLPLSHERVDLDIKGATSSDMFLVTVHVPESDRIRQWGSVLESPGSHFYHVWVVVAVLVYVVVDVCSRLEEQPEHFLSTYWYVSSMSSTLLLYSFAHNLMNQVEKDSDFLIRPVGDCTAISLSRRVELFPILLQLVPMMDDKIEWLQYPD